MEGASEEEDPMIGALEDFCRRAGEEVFAELFLGGATRIAQVAAWLQRMQSQGVDFAVVTRGTSTAVLRALATVPEWMPFFPSCRIWDTSQNRHSIASGNAMKALMLRDMCPSASRVLLVDDSINQDPSPEWVLKAANVETFALPYEGPGVTEMHLKEIE